MGSAIGKPVCLALAAALFAVSPVRAELGADDLKGSAAAPNAVVDRRISVDEKTRWVNVEYGQTVEFLVNARGGSRSFVWRFDGLAQRVDLSDISREAGLKVSIFVNQATNPLFQSGGY